MEAKLFYVSLFVIVWMCLVEKGESQQRLPRPQRIRVLFRNPTRVVLSWEQPSGARYVSYLVSVRPPTATVMEPEDLSASSREINNLRPGDRYVVSLRGVTADGRNSPPNNYDLWSEPLPPTNLTVMSFMRIRITLAFFGLENAYSSETVGLVADWSESSSATSLTGYNVQISPRHGTETFPRPLEGQEIDFTSRIFVGLVPGEEYTLTVRTQTGPPYRLVYSSSISQTIRIPPAIPYSAEISELGSRYVNVQTIGPLAGMHDELYLELEPAHGRVSFPRPDPFRDTHNLYVINGLSPGTTYLLKVYSVSHEVRSVNHYSAEFTTRPLAPSDVEVVYFTPNSVTLRWTQLQRVEIESIEYVIEIRDTNNLGGDIRTERVLVAASNSTVYATISNLLPGVVYRFSVLTLLNGITSEMRATVIHSTTPPEPMLEFFDGVQEGIMLRVIEVFEGQCPNISVTYSPPLPGETTVEPRIFQTGSNITLPGIPRDKRYTIHIRCVRNHIEGPPLIVSSRAEFNTESGIFQDNPNLPRIRLACIGPDQNNTASTSRRSRVADFIPPDGCCGAKSYRKLQRTCCGGRLYPRNNSSLCCGTKLYSLASESCCGNSTIAPVEVGCEEIFDQ